MNLEKSSVIPVSQRDLTTWKASLSETTFFFLKSKEKVYLGAYLDDKGKGNIHFQQVAKISIMQLLSR